MRKEISEEETIGKTVEGMKIYYEKMVISFTDGTFIHFRIDRGYDDEIEIIRDEIDIFAFGDEYLISLGLLTQEELDKKRRKRDQEMKREREQMERRQYECLSSKYGSKGKDK